MKDQALINKARSTQQVVQDRTRVFGYSGGVPNLAMDAKDSGLDCNPVEGGRLLPFFPGKAGYLGGWDEMNGGYKRLHVDIMPTSYRFEVNKRFHSNEDFGYRDLDMLTKLPYGLEGDDYIDQAYDYFAVVHPKLHNCPYGLNQKIQTSDPEVGESSLVWQFCPTCQLEDLKSPACEDRIFKASQTLDSGILADLRASLIEACEAALRHVTSKSQMVLSDIARKMTGTQPGRNTINTIDRIHLKMLHREENQQSNTATETIRGLAREMAGIMSQNQAPQAPMGGVVLDPEEAAKYEAYKARAANMAKAREAKTPKAEETNESNTGSGHDSSD